MTVLKEDATRLTLKALEVPSSIDAGKRASGAV
jgi:hypothetical protein